MDYLEFAQDVVNTALNAGAHEAEVYIQTGSEFHVQVRMGDIESLTQASFKGLGLRVFVDKRMGFSSTTDLDPDVLTDMAKTTVQLAKSASRDRFNGLPEVGQGVAPHLDLYDPKVLEIPAERKIEMAKEAEKAAFDFDPRIKNSEGASVSTYEGTRIIANSNGILYSNSGTEWSISCAPVAEQDNEKQVSYYWSSKRFFEELDPPTEVGIQAAVRTIRKLGARKVRTQKVPVVFSWFVGPVLLGAVFTALDGDNVHRGLSFLRKKLDKQIASPVVTLIDDPLMPRGLGSMPFDGEGVLCTPKTIVENGILKLYIYDTYSARKYGAKPSGNARRGFSSLPSISPSNFYLKPTNLDPADIIRGIKNGFYVTEVMGQGINTVTGDFSLGAAGIWIEDGELSYPVQEVTIAGNMLDMLKNIEQVANDVHFISSIVSPTFKIAEMTVSGT
jgi:PmbA protein